MDPAAGYEQLRAATMASQGTANPLGASPQIAKLYDSTFALQPKQQQAVVDSAQAEQQVEQQKIAQKAAIEKQAKLADIKEYKFVKKEDGGYDFFDPDGQQVDIATLSQRTGKKAAEIIADSENPIDIQYREDFKNLEEFMNAVLTRDKKKVEQFKAAAPELAKYNDRGGISRLIEDFKKSYERYYVPRSVNPQSWGKQPGGVVVPTRQTGQDSFDLGDGGGIGE